MAYRNDKRDNYDRRTRTSRDATPRNARPTGARQQRQQRSQSQQRQQRPVRSQRSTQQPASRRGVSAEVGGGSRPHRGGRAAAPTRRSRDSADARPPRAQRLSRDVASARKQRPSRSAQADQANSEQAEHARTLFAVPGGRYEGPTVEEGAPSLVSTSVGELRRADRADRAERMRKSSRRYLFRLIAIIGVVVALLAGWAALYNSPAFTIQHVAVNGVEHLTGDEMSQLANVPQGETLLRVDTETIRKRLMQTAWVENAEIKRVFPDTLEIDVTERTVQAIVEIPTSSGSAVKKWAIAEDHIWLMPIPDEGTEAAKTTSSQIYADAAAALHIVDVPLGTKAEIGEVCADGNVNNALDIVSGMTTDLASHVVKVSAAGTAETTLILDSGVEIAFGKAEDIRDKERVILKILEENPDGVAYINVRMVEQPTWRAV